MIRFPSGNDYREGAKGREFPEALSSPARSYPLSKNIHDSSRLRTADPRLKHVDFIQDAVGLAGERPARRGRGRLLFPRPILCLDLPSPGLTVQLFTQKEARHGFLSVRLG